jgi:hypothetical protein
MFIIIYIIFILLLVYKIIKINDEINAKNEIIDFLKKDAIKNIKNNLELSEQKYIISDLNNKLKKEIEVKNKLKKIFKRKKIMKTSSEVFQDGNQQNYFRFRRSYSF